MPSFELALHRRFVADHFHEEPYFVEARHGHNWEIQAAAQLESTAAEAAFAQALDAWIALVDYSVLNEQAWLARRNPTTELLAQWACEHLQASGLPVTWVKVREKANYWALCRPASLAA
ncbi:MAG TPA: 6-carboxytetrahydropterin synthase [Holophagaceae bacterium]|nr:6-carboxytetrahydropterin synthase [Holophagaceae bacterium]